MKTSAHAGAVAALVWLLAAFQTPESLADGRNGPWINLLDARELEATSDLEPLSPAGLTAADLDGDGLPDLIAAYDGPSGAWLAVYRANLDARDPRGPRARQHRAEGTFRAAPFLPGTRVFRLPARPQVLGAADLDGDRHADVVFADGLTAGLWWLPGTDTGDLGPQRYVPLPGAVTALATGDLDRRDGKRNVAVGIRTARGARVLVLGHRDGGVEIVSSPLALAAPVLGMAWGPLDTGNTTDLAVAAGNELTLLPEGGAQPRRRSFAAPIRALAFGDFAESGRRGRGLALLLDDGALLLLRRDAGAGGGLSVTSLRERAAGPEGEAGLAALNLSNRPGHDLLLLDPDRRRLSVRVGGLSQVAWATLETAAPAVSVLPMQLNEDVFSDLVLQVEGTAAPTLLMTAPSSVFTVDSTADDPDATLADGLCATAGGACTLRAAIEQANAAAGTHAIAFDIPGTGPHTIQPLSGLPPITDPLLVDGTTEPDYAGTPVVELDGSLAGMTDGLMILTGSSTIEGLAINRFAANGVSLGGVDAVENRIQATYLGTDLAGTAAAGNTLHGVFVYGGAQLNVIGTDGDGVADDREGNLISGNGGNGVLIVDQDTDGNVVAGNLIGVDLDGTSAVANVESGVAVVNYPASCRVGTNGDGISDAEERNVLSGNVYRGVLVAGEAEQNVVAGNYVGTDLSGTQALPNEGGGVEISNGARQNRIGTDADGQSDTLERNVISGNGAAGISLFGSPSTDGNVIAGNYIGTQADGASPLGNQSHGIIVNTVSSYTRIGGLGVTPRSCDGPCNVIAFNGIGGSLDGVRIIDGICNAVVGNVIHSNNNGAGIDLGTGATSYNDPGDVDGGPNNGQNFPILTEAVSSAGTTTVLGTLDSTPSTEFHLELYANSTCDPSGFGEGQTLVAVSSTTTGTDGQASFSIPVTPELAAGQWLSITATRMEPGNVPTDTSEFSPCLGVGPLAAAGTVPDGDGLPGTQLTVERGAVGAEAILSWAPSCVAADVDYAIYMGTIGDFTSHYARRCSTEGQTTASLRTNEPGVYFLVVPLSFNRDGSYGVDSDGVERPPGFSICHPQLIGACD